MRGFIEKNIHWLIPSLAALFLFATSAVVARAVEPIATRVTSLEAQYQAIQMSLDEIKQEQREQRQDTKRLLERRQ